MPRKKTHLPLKRKTSESKSYQEKQAELYFWHPRGVTGSQLQRQPLIVTIQLIAHPTGWHASHFMPRRPAGAGKNAGSDAPGLAWDPGFCIPNTFLGDAIAGPWTSLNQSEHSNH